MYLHKQKSLYLNSKINSKGGTLQVQQPDLTDRQWQAGSFLLGWLGGWAWINQADLWYWFAHWRQHFHWLPSVVEHISKEGRWHREQVRAWTLLGAQCGFPGVQGQKYKIKTTFFFFKKPRLISNELFKFLSTWFPCNINSPEMEKQACSGRTTIWEHPRTQHVFYSCSASMLSLHHSGETTCTPSPPVC